ncbi:hypothetical protein A9R16_003245 [Acidiferrobacter thiooxydans]|uniref:hypothetical protein n=1 Tax=Acidiferrobacter thiooxydans TaxID=163359 RepID=UPI0008246FF7|nr:hypothetical protein [Acidiferrobacter thiooxydans]UEO00432.1 hypothetical protein A9R16_003245 [Acidiferrobacter thiooxydans]
MTTSEARRQKQLTRKRQKRKAKTHKPNSGESWSLAVLATQAPIHECLVPAELFEQGIGNLVFSRSLPDGRIAVAMFLLDVFCLGVKNALSAVVTPNEYARRVRSLPTIEHYRRVDAACFCQLVKGAVDYARDLGFPPHGDYAVASQIWGGLPVDGCLEPFEYGHKGMPYYVSGPNETVVQAQGIVEHLARRLGPDKFHYTVFVP